MEKPNYGQPIPYDPLWKGPVIDLRKKTDPVALKFYCIFLILWLGVSGIYGIGYTIWLNPKQQTVENGLEPTKEHKIFNTLLHGTISERISISFNFFARFPLEMFYIIVYNPIGLLTIFGCSILAAFLSVIFIVLAGRCTKITVWVSLGLLCLFIIFKIILSFYLGRELIIYGIVLLIALIAIIFVFGVKGLKKLEISCEIVKDSSRAVFASRFHFFLSVVQFFLLLTNVIFLANNMRLLIELYKNSEPSRGYLFLILLFFLHLGNLVGYIWAQYFINGIKSIILSGSFATWYWTTDKTQVPKNTVQTFTTIVRKYHLGTVAIGSIFMAICDAINAFLRDSLQQATSENKEKTCAALVLRCCETLVYAVMYVSQSAYVMTAVHATDFYTSGKNSFNLIMRNVEKIVVITQVSSIIFTGGAIIAIGIPSLVAFFLPNSDKIFENLVLITFIVVTVLAISILDLLQSAIATVYLSILEDYERNSGTLDQPYYMNDRLTYLIGYR